MKQNQRSLKLFASVAVFTLAAFIISCSKNSDPINGTVSATVSNEATQDSQQDEVDDMATGQLNVVAPNGRANILGDHRVACALVSVDTLSKTAGTVTIYFDSTKAHAYNPSGCTDAKGNVRKGKITISWEGHWLSNGTVVTIVLTNYSINGVVHNGTRTLTNVTTTPLIPTWNLVSDLTITWPDSKTATRQAHKTRAWDIVGGIVTVTKTDGQASAASGTTRHGVSYTMDITAPLVFNIACVGSSKVYIPVSGTKVITFENKTVTVDFGSGTCDNTFTVTYNGKTDTFTGSNGSNN